jgi:predicted nuclease with TOPRIM domain
MDLNEKIDKVSKVLLDVIDKLNQNSNQLRQLEEENQTLKERIQLLESSQSETTLEYKQSRTNQNVTSEKKQYQEAVNGIEIPGLNGYRIYENQAVKSPDGVFLKPFMKGDRKYVEINGMPINVRQVHAKLHLIPTILQSKDYSDSHKESIIKSICNKHNLLIPASLYDTK